MGGLLLLRKLSLTKDLAEIMTAIAPGTGTGTVVVIVIAAVIMEVVVDLVVETASSVGSQVILLGNVPVEGTEEVAGMVVGMIGMAVVAAVAVVEGVMVLIGMEIDLGDVVGILVVVGEVTDIVVTVLDHMTAGVQEVSDLDEMTA